jgi:hypothetical protein
MTGIRTDYLVVGAGASGMAFADALIAESDADVVLVDRRHSPGGHWNDAYPFVRLHQPSAFYGVNSQGLGSDSIDQVGANAGFYERATAAEVCVYYQRVLEQHLLPSGRVRFFGMSDYLGTCSDGHQFVSRLTGETTTVKVRRRVVDATYLETSVPAKHTPSFVVDSRVRVIPPNGLVELPWSGTGYTVIGAGKTAMDACSWLLDNGVAPETIRWIRPRDAWLLDRGSFQPLKLLPSFIEGLSLQIKAAAQAEDVDDLFRRLEGCGQLIRLDPEFEPTMYRGAIASADERDGLRRIENVVRQGRVIRIATDRVVLDHGTIRSDPGQVYVDCTAAGLRAVPARPIFEPRRITLQSVRSGNTPFNAALIAFIEASRDDDVDKNRLCPPNPHMNAARDWLPATLITQRAQAAWSREPDLKAWLQRSRLDIARGIRDHLDDRRMQSALTRLTENREPAIANLERLLTPDVRANTA